MLLLSLLSVAIHGMVVDSESGVPLAGAAVVLEDRGAGTYTDENGHFMLMNAPEPPVTLLVSMVGYETKSVELSEIPSHLSIGLNPAAISSDEVEVISSPTLHDMSQSPIPTQKLDAKRIQSANQTSVWMLSGSCRGSRSGRSILRGLGRLQPQAPGPSFPSYPGPL